jgi:glyoxylase-like metal-dependent hydrolase (beta-lactamase superfamily II)
MSEAKLEAIVIPVTPFVQNCTLLWCAESRKAAVVDPGGDLERIEAAIEERDVTLEKILITHGHIDHAGGAAELAERRSVPIEGPQKEDAFWIDGIAQQGLSFGLAGARPFTPERWLEGGDHVQVGELDLEVRHCPGHTPGHVIFFHPPSALAIVGDVLFRGSIGRTDFPRGDHATLLRSIREQLWPLGDEVTFVPGHGELSTFGEERRSNPFCGDTAFV